MRVVPDEEMGRLVPTAEPHTRRTTTAPKR